MAQSVFMGHWYCFDKTQVILHLFVLLAYTHMACEKKTLKAPVVSEQEFLTDGKEIRKEIEKNPSECMSGWFLYVNYTKFNKSHQIWIYSMFLLTFFKWTKDV